jgi:phage portal protein BeeE
MTTFDEPERLTARDIARIFEVPEALLGGMTDSAKIEPCKSMGECLWAAMNPTWAHLWNELTPTTQDTYSRGALAVAASLLLRTTARHGARGEGGQISTGASW